MPRADLSSLPKVVLHDHLDGGLRPQTLIDLAVAAGYRGLPTTDAAELASLLDQRESGSLERYLEAFVHTVSVMQTPEAVARVMQESIEDLANDGVVYAEIRFAPSLLTAGGLAREQVLEIALEAMQDASARFGLPVRLIVDAMRQHDDSLEVVESALKFVDQGVVAFDLAGPEAGYPIAMHAAALQRAREAALPLTLHAGEGTSPGHVAKALDAGAARIGHGLALVDDCEVSNGEVTGFGPIASRVMADRPVLEVCPTSGLGTGAYVDPGDHPLGIMHRAGFPITLNTDNRLMSRTSMTSEFAFAVEHHGFEVADLRRVTLRAVEGAFCGAETQEPKFVRVWKPVTPA